MSQIRIALDNEIAELLGISPEQFDRRALEMIVLEIYRQHEIAGGRAAEILEHELLLSGSLHDPRFLSSQRQGRNSPRIRAETVPAAR